MNVLWIIHYATYSGPHNMVAELAPRLRDHGVNSVVLIPSEPGSARERLERAGVDVVQTRLGRLRHTLAPNVQARFALQLRRDVRRVRGVIRATNSDLVILGGLHNPHGAIAGRLEGTPVIWQIIDSRTPGPSGPPLIWLAERLGDVLMFWGASLRSHYLGPPEYRVATEVFGPIVDTQRFRARPDLGAKTRASLEIPSDAKVVGIVGNVNPQKGVEYFVEAAAHILDRHPDAYFVICGAQLPTQEQYIRRIRAKIEASSVPRDAWRFLDATSSPHELFPAFDVKVISSVPASEGIPTVALEAMACEVPVVATNVGAVRDAIIDGHTGLLVPPEDADVLADAVSRLLESPHEARALAVRGRELVHDRFNAESCADAHLRAFSVGLRDQ